MKELKYVSSLNGDWIVIYSNDGPKIWEGDYVDSGAVESIAEHFGHNVRYYEFTDEDEIDGFTPDNFNDIIGIEEFK